MENKINQAFITLPAKNWLQNRLFLESFGIKVIGNDYPIIRVGFGLVHEQSGVIARIRELIQVPCGRGSSVTRYQLRVTNMKCDSAVFQKLFYDYFDSYMR